MAHLPVHLVPGLCVHPPWGANRCGKIRQCVNILVVWALTGFWHGAGWNFLFWGFYYGILLLIEKLVLGKYIRRLPAPVQHLYTMVIVVIGWVFFASPDLSTALDYLQVMFSFTPGTVGTASLVMPWLAWGSWGFWPPLPWPKPFGKRSRTRSGCLWPRGALCLAGLLLCCLLAAGCTLGPDYKRPDLDLPAASVAADEPGALFTRERWWEVFHDDALNRLEEAALAHNSNLAQAMARVEEARAAAGVAFADRLPAVGLRSQDGKRLMTEGEALQHGPAGLFILLVGDEPGLVVHIGGCRLCVLDGTDQGLRLVPNGLDPGLNVGLVIVDVLGRGRHVQIHAHEAGTHYSGMELAKMFSLNETLTNRLGAAVLMPPFLVGRA